MDPANSKVADLERRRSRRSSVRVSVHGGEEEGFDHADGTIADGFRPSQQTPLPDEPETPAPASSPVSIATVPSTSATLVGSDAPSPPSRPSSIVKHPRGAADSFSLRHDGGMGPIEETPLAPRSSSSTADSQAYLPPESPYHGPSNPSHPYQMYPQNVRMARTLSVTTTSTAPVSESSFATLRAPTHPYTMYPQNTASESSPVAPTVIPVGFPGIADQYQRRIGPEGEDIGDIIGPDGHTEQLPPYTRYPDEQYAVKLAAAQQSTATPAATSPTTEAVTAAATASLAVPQPIPGAGGIGLATRNPEVDSIDGLDSPRSRQSCRSFTSDASNQAINGTGTEMSEKEERTDNSRWGRRRVGGIVPYWAICLTVFALVMMGAVMGSVMGVFLAKHKRPPSHHDNNDNDQEPMPTVTMTYDATPIPTPIDLPPLLTGTFGMPLMKNRESSSCLNNTQLSQAWNCNIVMFAGFSMTVEENLKTPELGDYTISLTSNESVTLVDYVYSYGEQPPQIIGPIPLELVNDTLEPGRGPAWFMMAPFNKTVILPEPLLEPSNGEVSSSQYPSLRAFGSGPGDLKRKGTAQSGDRPWNSSWNRFPPTATAAVSSYTTGIPPQPTGIPPQPTGSIPFDGTGGFIPTSAITGDPGEHPTGDPGDHPTFSGDFPPSTTGQFDFPGPPPLPPYPKVVKLEERRIPHSPNATCRQVEIVGDGQPARPVKDANGNDVIIYIIENAPSIEQRSYEERRPLDYRDISNDLTDCGCIWFIT